MNTSKNGFILNEDSINFQQLKIFFTKLEELEIPNLKKQFNITENIKDIYSFPIKSYVRKKESTFNNDLIDGKIINELNKDIHNSNYLEDKHSIEYKLQIPKKYDSNLSLEYIYGLQWIYNYYFLNKIDYSWYYPYEKSPFIHEINIYLSSIKELPEHNDNYPLIFTPIEQTVFTSPIDITSMLSSKYKYITNKFYNKYKITNILEKIQNTDCTSSNYLSKCSLKNIDHPIYKLSPKEFIKEFRTDKTTKEFLKYIKYYTLTNDPYFYSYISK